MSTGTGGTGAERVPSGINPQPPCNLHSCLDSVQLFTQKKQIHVTIRLQKAPRKLVLSPGHTYREDRSCRHWAKTAALWCAVSRRGPEPDGSLRRDPGLIYWSQGHQEDADQPRKRRRNEREAAASSVVPGTAGADAAGSAAACW